MNSQEILSLFVRTSKTKCSTVVEVAQIEWEGPHTPITKWSMYKELSHDVTESDLIRTKNTLLKDSKYFLTCDVCNRLNPRGWMHNDTMCDSCAETELGIVH